MGGAIITAIKRKFFYIILIAFMLMGLNFYFGNNYFWDGCEISIQEKIVRGSSLSGLIEEGKIVKIAFGFYSCNEIQREDIVAYKFSGNPEPIIKVVKGLPGDKFSLKRIANYWQIFINNQAVKNSANAPYQLGESSYNLLNLYVKDYQGVIPADAYLILGNLPSGTSDSSSFGLAGRRGIVGKVIAE